MKKMCEKQGISLPTYNLYQSTRRSPQYMRELVFACVAFLLICQLTISSRQWYSTEKDRGLSERPANSTLGFGAIYAVSRKNSPRRDSLLRAAYLTNLDIDIPNQPSWTEDEIASMRAPVNSTLNRGSALAWLGHLNVLDHFLQTNDDTALIIEDDVDWDTRLRAHQMPQTAYAIRDLVDSREGYYGSIDTWDILWLGHCGDYFNASRGSAISKIKSYTDLMMPEFDKLHPWTQEFMDEIGANDDHQRLVHESVRPLCTFAYAVTRPAAERLLNEIAFQEPARPAEHPCSAFDVRMLESCRDEGLKCISVNPELFHHTDLASEIAAASEAQKRQEGEKKDESSTATTNIRCSARSQKWIELRASIQSAGVDTDRTLRAIAESDRGCYIDGM